MIGIYLFLYSWLIARINGLTMRLLITSGHPRQASNDWRIICVPYWRSNSLQYKNIEIKRQLCKKWCCSLENSRSICNIYNVIPIFWKSICKKWKNATIGPPWQCSNLWGHFDWKRRILCFRENRGVIVHFPVRLIYCSVGLGFSTSQ